MCPSLCGGVCERGRGTEREREREHVCACVSDNPLPADGVSRLPGTLTDHSLIKQLQHIERGFPFGAHLCV